MISFFINVELTELIALRYGLTTSMFISAVMYHFSQMSMLPGLGVLKLFDKFMIAVYLFLAATIVVTTLCYLALVMWKRPELVKPIDRYGMVVSILLPIVSFWLLVTLV
jgi:predicted membrane protein